MVSIRVRKRAAWYSFVIAFGNLQIMVQRMFEGTHASVTVVAYLAK